MTDLFVKPFDTNQFLDPSPSHPYHCKKGISYIHALRLNINAVTILNDGYRKEDTMKKLQESKQ